MDSPRVAPGVVYLDYMGAGLYTERQLRESYLGGEQCPPMGNPHSSHAMGTTSREEISAARQRILQFLGASEEYSVVFTSGCTGALRMVAEGFPFDDPAGATIAVHFASHNSVVGMREVAVSAGATFLGTFDDPASYRTARTSSSIAAPHLVVYPLECNFSGSRYPLSEWAHELHTIAPRTFVCVDGAAAAGKMPIVLDGSSVDFFALSFYKLFGFPTGLGALVVRKETASACLAQRKKYFGGGTVEFVVPGRCGLHRLRSALAERMEDGTPNFLAIRSLRAGFSAVERCGGVTEISLRISNLVKFTTSQMEALRHFNGTPMIRIHRDGVKASSSSSCSTDCGSSIAFSVVDASGSAVGHSLVEQLAGLHGVMVRSGCFCNPGACQRYLCLSDEDILRFAEAGHVCWDEHDVIDGRPTGCVRASFGMYSTEHDALSLVAFLRSSFLQTQDTPTRRPSTIEAPFGRRHYIVKHIEVFPLKGAFGFAPPEWPISRSGLQFDREWMIISASDCAALTPKRCIRVTSLDVALSLHHNVLTIRCRDRSWLPQLCIAADEQRAVTAECSSSAVHRCVPRSDRLKGAMVRGRVLDGYRSYSSKVNQWISEALGVESLLVRQFSDSFKNSKEGSLLVVDWRSHEAVLSATPVEERWFTWHAYRANIVLSSKDHDHHRGLSSSLFEEMELSSLGIGQQGRTSIALQGCEPCHRCTQLGVRRDGTIYHQPLTSISRLCQSAKMGSPVFGKLFSVANIDRTVAADDADGCHHVVSPHVGSSSATHSSLLLVPAAAVLIALLIALRFYFVVRRDVIAALVVLGITAVVSLLRWSWRSASPPPPLSAGPLPEGCTMLRLGMDVTATATAEGTAE